MKSKLGQLRQKLERSGFAHNPVISYEELEEMLVLYRELVDFLGDTNNMTMKHAFYLEMLDVEDKFLSKGYDDYSKTISPDD